MQKDEKMFSDSRWHDNPFPIDSKCSSCKFYNGFLKCEKYDPEIPIDIMRKSFPSTEEFDEDYCPYRTIKR